MTSPTPSSPIHVAILLAAALLASTALHANPSGGQVAAGAAQISAQGSTLTITQGSDRAIINWQDFSIATGETTRFVQPSSTSAMLNRVTGGNPSQIYGNLNANGQVYLINPNGVLVGAGGVVNTAGFLASTLDVSDDAFLRGGDLRFTGTSNASVVNLGSISASEGDVILIARTVENRGEIRAPRGTAALAAGSEVLVKAAGEERVFVQPESGRGDASATQAGLIEAATAELKAAGGNEYALAIKHSGVTRATGVSKSGGRVFLSAGGKGGIRHSGSIQARGSDGSGGKVRVEAAEIELVAGSTVDASADTGIAGDGGEVLVGGGLRGRDTTMRNAGRLLIDDGATIRADGAGTGSGGRVVLWADGRTEFGGAVFARGGELGGAGGFVEVSGKEVLNFRGRVDTGGGTLLIDPATLTVQATAGNQDNTWGVGQIDAHLANNNLVLEADTSINWLGTAVLTYTNTVEHSLTLRSGGNIVFDSGASITPGVGAAALNIVLNADRDATGGGNIQLTGTTIQSNGGAIVLGGGANPLTTPAIGSGTGSTAQKPGIFLWGSTLNSGAGAMSLLGRGIAGTNDAYGIFALSASLLESTTGAISLHGTGGAGTSSNFGVYLAGANTAVRSVDGDLSLIGVGGAGSGGSNLGIYLTAAATVSSTGTGANAGKVTLHGTGGAGTSGNVGVWLSGTNTALSAKAGNLSITGIGQGSGASNRGIFLSGFASPTTTTTGEIRLTGHAAAGTTEGILFDSAARVGGTTTLGNIFLISDQDIRLATGSIETGVGGGTLTLEAGGSIVTTVGSSLLTQGQAIILNADRDATGGGSIQLVGTTITSNGGAITLGGGVNPLTTPAIGSGTETEVQTSGIYLSGSNLSSGAGPMSLRGRGISGTNNAFGIYAESASVLESTTGAITLHGTGGTGSSSNFGVYLFTNTAVTSVDGDLSLTGVGGAGSDGSNYGIFMNGAARVSSTGTGVDAAKVTLHGTGGSGTSQNLGVFLVGANTAVTSVSGDLSLTGVGGPGSSSDNYGIFIASAATVSSTGMGANAANVTLRGTGGAGASGNYGVYLFGTNTAVTSVDGDLSLTGVGGAGSSSSNTGIFLTSAATVSSTGTGINAGAVTLHGTGGGTGASAGNWGVSVESGGQITAGGLGGVNVTGLGGNTTGTGGNNNRGVVVSGSGATITSGGGAVTVHGTGGGSGSSDTNVGVSASSGGLISAGGTGAVSVTGLGGNTLGTGGANYGVWIIGVNAAITSGGGSVTVHGTGGGSGSSLNNQGIRVDSAGRITAGGTGGVNVTGLGGNTAGTGGTLNHGVLVTGVNSGIASAITSGGGAVNVHGTGGGAGSSSSNDGVRAQSGGQIGAGGTGAVNVTGLGGTAGTGGANHGVFVTGLSSGIASAITSGGGAVTVNGTGGGAGSSAFNNGVNVNSAGQIRAGGLGAVSVTGLGGNIDGTEGDSNHGVHVTDSSSSITSGGGSVHVHGTGGGAGSSGNNIGVLVNPAALIGAGGTGAVSVTGLGGNTAGAGESNRGVRVNNSTITSAGAITVLGEGGGGTNNHGFTLEGSATVTSTGSGEVVLATPGTFFNSSGAGAVSSATGRWLIYSAAPSGNTYGELLSGNQALYNHTFSGNPPATITETGNRYLFSEQPILNFTTTSDAKTYGDDFSGAIVDNFTVSGFIDASLYGGVFTQDTLVNTTTGTALASSTGAAVTATVGSSPYGVLLDLAPVSATSGYAFAKTESGMLTVTPKALTITANNQSKTFGDTFTFAGTEFGTSELINGDTVTSATLASAGAVATANVAGSPYAITASSAVGTGLGNYAISYLGGSLSVGQRDITVNALGGTSIYGDSPVNPGLSATNLASFDTVAALTGLSNSFGITSGSTVNAYTMNVAGTLSNGNYHVTTTAGTWNVTPKALTVTANNQSKVYGNTLAFAGTEFTSRGLINGDAVTGVSLSSAGAAARANVAGGPYAIAGSGAVGTGLENYTLHYESGALRVTPRPIRVTALGGRSSAGSSPRNPGLRAGNLASFDSVSALRGLKNRFGINSRTPAGTHKLRVIGRLKNPNYRVVARNRGTWTVVKGPLKSNGGRFRSSKSPVSNARIPLASSGTGAR